MAASPDLGRGGAGVTTGVRPPYDAVILGLDGVVADTDQGLPSLLGRRGVRAFPGTEALLRRLRAGAVRTGLVTTSRHARVLLEAAGICDLFDVLVDGTTAQGLHLAEKPDPAMLLEAARRLRVDPGRAAVVEGGVPGVQAARRGGFGLVVGIDRNRNRAALEAAGADLVLDDVGELDLGARRDDRWTVGFEGFDPAHEAHREP